MKFREMLLTIGPLVALQCGAVAKTQDSKIEHHENKSSEAGQMLKVSRQGGILSWDGHVGMVRVRLAEHASSLDEAYLDLSRSRDGRVLYRERLWDDGHPERTIFEVVGDSPNGWVLQFVDGVFKSLQSTETATGSVFRVGDNQYQSFDEAWIIDPAGKRALRPSTSVWYPLRLAKGSTRSNPTTLQWMAFSWTCGGEGEPCVFYGRPADVCRSYMHKNQQGANAGLMFAPAGCW